MTDDIAKALTRAQILAAIEAIEQYTNALVDEGPENYLSIQHRLITSLEAKL